MFAEHAFDVKHLDPGGWSGVTPPREDRRMPATRPHTVLAGAAPAVAASSPMQFVRLPEAVYRRRRAAVAVMAAALLTLALVVARPDSVPRGEINLWPSVGEASVPTELPGVYVVQPGDTLWDIARAIAPGADPRPRVHELAEAAGGAALEPGQLIVIDAALTAHTAVGSAQRAGQQIAGLGGPVEPAGQWMAG